MIKIFKYLAVGGFQFVFDLLLFLLLQQAGFSIFLSNTISRLSAATLGYLFNKGYTFSVGHVQGYSMAFRYWGFWAFMTGLSSLLIWQWSLLFKDSLHIGIGKFSIESILCIVGFFISKRWVYRHAP
jgi:putative flippase GtrA